MQYYALAHKKHHFIVTPNELSLLLQEYHHVIVNTGVPRNYTESNPNDFISEYKKIYTELKYGNKPVLDNNCTIGITMYLENCLYKVTGKLLSPNFVEPCPWIEPFSFTLWNDRLSTAFAVHQFPENICGLCLYFPTKIEYKEENAKHHAGIAIYSDFDDFETYNMLISSIKEITTPLKLETNGKIYRTSVRISNEAKKDIDKFYFMTSNRFSVL